MTRMRTRVMPTTSCLVLPLMCPFDGTTSMRMHMTNSHQKMVCNIFWKKKPFIAQKIKWTIISQFDIRIT